MRVPLGIKHFEFFEFARVIRPGFKDRVSFVVILRHLSVGAQRTDATEKGSVAVRSDYFSQFESFAP